MLKQIAVSAISTAKDIYDTIYIIFDYQVGIFPFNFNKCDVTNTLLPHDAADPLYDRSAEHMESGKLY